ncbi:MAG: hypothetical protein R2867_43350 [Caldilineaceae bacterium]
MGKGGEGKTREAAELMGRAVATALLPSDQVFEPNRDFLNTAPTVATTSLHRQLPPDSPAFLHIDNLHAYDGPTLTHLGELVSVFMGDNNDRRYVGRDPAQRSGRCASSHPVNTGRISHRYLAPLRRSVLTAMAAQCCDHATVEIFARTERAFIEHNRQGTPEHLLRGLSTAQLEPSAQRFKPAQIRAVMDHIDAEQRLAMEQGKPAVTALLDAWPTFTVQGYVRRRSWSCPMQLTCLRRGPTQGRLVDRCGQTQPATDPAGAPFRDPL